MVAEEAEPVLDMPSRLNFGCGPNPPPGWANVDRDDYGQQGVEGGYQGDILRGGLPYGEQTFRYAVAHHSLQMIPYKSFIQALADLRRVLVNDGVLRVSVPDMRAAFDAWARGEQPWFPIVDDAEARLGGKLCAYVSWYSEARMVFTPAWLTELLVRAGFRQVAVCPYRFTFLGPAHICDLDDQPPRPRESIYVEARR